MLTPEQHLRIAVDLIRTMMASASSEQIRRIEWWSRAKSALETAAESASSFSSMVSAMGRKLQIDVTTVNTGAEVARLAVVIGDDFEGFRRYCARESLFAAAIAQAEAQERRAARERAGGADPTGLDKYEV